MAYFIQASKPEVELLKASVVVFFAVLGTIAPVVNANDPVPYPSGGGGAEKGQKTVKKGNKPVDAGSSLGSGGGESKSTVGAQGKSSFPTAGSVDVKVEGKPVNTP